MAPLQPLADPVLLMSFKRLFLTFPSQQPKKKKKVTEPGKRCSASGNPGGSIGHPPTPSASPETSPHHASTPKTLFGAPRSHGQPAAGTTSQAEPSCRGGLGVPRGRMLGSEGAVRCQGCRCWLPPGLAERGGQEEYRKREPARRKRQQKALRNRKIYLAKANQLMTTPKG